MRSYMENHVGHWTGEEQAHLLGGGSDDVKTDKLSREPMDDLWGSNDHTFGNLAIDSDKSQIEHSESSDHTGSEKLADTIVATLKKQPDWHAHGDYGWRERSQQHLQSYRNRSHGNRPVGIMHRRKV